MEPNRPAHRFGAALAAFAVPSGLFAALWAAERGRSGGTILGEFATPIEATIAVGGIGIDAAGGAMELLRIPVSCLCVIVLGWLAGRPAARRGAMPVVAAVVLGWAAQSFLLDGSIALGLCLYAGAVCGVALAAKGTAATAQFTSAREGAAILGLLALFFVLCLYRLEVDPNLYFDEMAYLRAARMFAGQVDVGRILGSDLFEVYVYEQFESQTIPLALQAAAIQLLSSDVIATRIASVLAVGAALVVAVLALRGVLGGGAALWMLGLAASAPLVVVYSRAGHYISISLLHSVVSFATLLWLWRRFDTPAALATGIAIGCSLYQYQLSWFVPVFAFVAFVISPTLWRRPGVFRVAGIVTASGVAVALPGLIWLDTGISAVSSQTFDRAVWNISDSRELPVHRDVSAGVLAIAPTPFGVEERRAIDARIEGRELAWKHEQTVQGESVVWISGLRPGMLEFTNELRDEGWRVLDFESIAKDPRVRLRSMLMQLFYAPSFESSGRWVDAPLLNPLLAPLLVLGMVMAWRRRDEPALRLLLVWVVCGALLPAIAAGAVPRRTTLMLPFAYALMALPLVAIGGACHGRGRASRTLAALLGFLFFLGATASGSYLYFREWRHQIGLLGGGGELLHLVKVLKTRPQDELVLIPMQFRGLDNYLDAGSASHPGPVPIARDMKTLPALAVLARSCEQPPPFTWMFRDAPAQRGAGALLEANFVVESEVREGIRVLRVVAVRGNLCEGHPGARPPLPDGRVSRPKPDLEAPR